MTWREAVAQAYRELGRSEESIAASARFADSQCLGDIQITKSHITLGQERQAIEALKALFRKIAGLSPAELENFIREAHKRVEKHRRNQ